MNDFELKVWRLHPKGIRILPAEKTLNKTANEGGLKWCGPYSSANKLGFWVFPPVDMDIIWNDKLECTLLEEWGQEEVPFIKSLIKETDTDNNKEFLNSFGGRVKVDCGRVEPNICQVWSGCAFETPPGWSLLIRSPINTNMDAPYRIQEGILETDWLPYDIWLNIAVQQKNVKINIRKNQWPPIAQLIPIRKAAYEENWTVKESAFNREDDIYERWADYNYKKYIKRQSEMPKDSGTYYKERSRNKSSNDAPKRIFGIKSK